MNMDEIYSRIGKNILFLRAQYGMSRKTLAKLIGIPLGRLRRVEVGDAQTRMYDFHIRRLADVFNISTENFIKEELFNK